MTEKQLKPDNKAQFIVKRVGFQYNVNKNSIECNNKHFAYCNGEEVKIAKKLNELYEENKELKQQLEDCEFAHRTEMAHHRVVEKELKEKIAKRDYTSMGLYDD